MNYPQNSNFIFLSNQRIKNNYRSSKHHKRKLYNNRLPYLFSSNLIKTTL